MSMALKLVPYQYQYHVTGMTGAGAGLFTTELLSEYTTRLLGWTSYLKAAAKSAVKLGLSSMALSFSARPGTSTNEKLFSQAFAFASMGSIFLDWLAAYMPGGIVGIANRLAISTKVMFMGTKTVSQALVRYETPQASVPAQSSTPPSSQVGRY